MRAWRPGTGWPGALTPIWTCSTPPNARAEALEAAARQTEDAARATPGVSNSEGGSATWSAGDWRLVTSHGFDGAHRGSSFSLGVGVIAARDGAMERGGEYRVGPPPVGPARRRGHRRRRPDSRAVARLGARKIASTTAPVIFENRLAAQVMSPFDRRHRRARRSRAASPS